jgi:GT2 family glycosyltransferase
MHLPACLDSLRLQTYPADSMEVIVVDNGSADDPTGEIHARFPTARVIRNSTNLGFAVGNNRGAAEATGHYLVFLNDDTRVEPDWLVELVGTARRRRAAAVASCIVDWSGSSIDFIEGLVNFEGKGFQLHYGAQVDSFKREEKPLFFPCGCAMLMDRDLFNQVGGWDEGTFAYYEDVELGWRLHVLGFEVWSSPKAVVYHKHHGTSEQWPEPPRQRLYERNALRILLRLLELDSLTRALPAALMLAADRALLASGFSRVADLTPQSAVRRFLAAGRAAFRARGVTKSMPWRQKFNRLRDGGFLRFARDLRRLSVAQHSRSRRDAYLMERGGMPVLFDSHVQPMPVEAAATLAGIFSFLSEIPKLAERRVEIQRRRRVKDQDVISRFGDYWVAPSPSRCEEAHQALHSVIVEEFELASLARGPVGAGSA